MIPAGSDRQHTHFDMMADRYGVDRTTAAKWSLEDGFPAILFTTGQGGFHIYDESAVDTWVREHRFGSWFQSQHGRKNPLDLPEGGPGDLLTLRRIGELEGQALNRPPTPVTTLRTYLSPSKGILPPPNRTPDDGLCPAVTEPMWFRETAYAYISRPRRTRRALASGAQPGTKRAPEVAQRENAGDLLDLDLPPGSETDLLTLRQIGEIDGRARGRGKAITSATLKNYQSRKLLAEPDRRPGDGREPIVEEPMWTRAAAYRFIRRPGRRTAARALHAGVSAPERPREDLLLPEGAETDLLTLRQIGEIDGRARGRGKATTVSSMRTYFYKGLLAEPDRRPGDGREPTVEEPMWTRAAAYRFIRRPGRLGGAR
ncbi:hypothetical protein [Streptomyces clavuligerus]|uniref:hypothetical protein n=1 Tax=Streptomyces clavuligerus TaxID=1901 RepID=UPI00020D9472|nr:hypothetical protein [Streptomyces clavuligerus]WDN56130.1 hypothetical protein LL058_30185 [Streptomyces clavuligerus]